MCDCQECDDIRKEFGSIEEFHNADEEEEA
jgi:hypothetical protein